MPHPEYLEHGHDKKFMKGRDIAIAEVEISKSTSKLTDEELEEFVSSLAIPDLKPIDLVESEYKFAFIPGYPA